MVCRILLVGLVFSSGCVPMMVYTFYEPSAETGVVERQTCYGNAGPRNTIRFQQDDLKLRISSLMKGNRDIVVTVSVALSQETVLQFLSQDFNIKKEGEASSIRPSEVSAIDYNPYRESGPLTQWTTLQGSNHSYYHVSFDFPISNSTHFELQFPPMELNQQKFLIPPITFSKKTESFFIEPINC